MNGIWLKFRSTPWWAQTLLWLFFWPLIGGLFFWRSEYRHGRSVAVGLVAIGVAFYAAAGAGQPSDKTGATEPVLVDPVPSETMPAPEPTLIESEASPAKPAAAASVGIPVETATVSRVIDGDTIEVRMAGTTERVRLIGIDTPERGRELFSEASAFTAQWAGSGTKLFLELDVEERDRYGRLLAYVWLNKPSASPSESEILNSMLNAKLLFQGFAKLLTVPPNVNYVDAFTGYQEAARISEKRLWEPAPPPPPKKPSGGGGNCDPNYSGACLDPNAEDYDCAGGSGNGPKYVEGPVYVEGDDHYGLDSDNDGVGCEP